MRISLAIIFCCISSLTWAQIAGTSPISVGSSAVYTYSDDVVYTNYSWEVINGTVSASSRSGINYRATINWHTVGTGTIRFLDGSGTVLASRTVSVGTCTGPVTPTVSFTISTNACGNKTITRSGTPPTGTTWYWQTSPSGIDTNNSSATFTASTSGSYYIRAKNSCTWSSGVSGTPVTVKIIPTVAAANKSICSGGLTGILLTNNVAGTSNAWTVSSSGVTGASAGSGVATSSSPFLYTINQTLTAAALGTATYTITPTANGCSGSAHVVTATVKPVPTISTNNSVQYLCSGGTTAISFTNPNNLPGTTYSWNVVQSNVTGGSAAVNVGTTSISQPLTSVTGNTAGTANYTITPAANGCTGSSASVLVNVNPVPIASAAGQSIFSNSAVSIPLNSTVANTTFTYAVNSVSNVSNAVAGSGSPIIRWLTVVDELSAGTVRYSFSPSIAGCTGATAFVDVSVYPMPFLYVNGAYPAASTLFLNYGQGMITLSTRVAYYSYQWSKDGVPIPGETQAIFQPTNAGVYAVTVRSVAGGPTATSGVITVLKPNGEADSVAMASVTRFFSAGITTATSPYTLSANQLSQVISYQDGLGRPIQTVAVAASPLNTDLVVPTPAGKNGLADSTFLPYATTVAQGRFRKNAVRGSSAAGSYSTSEQSLFYQGIAAQVYDEKPYARSLFRNTPDARVIEQGAPGEDWQPGTSHTVRNRLDLSKSTSYPVRLWKADGITTGNYPDRTVVVAITTDENDHLMHTYTDKRGLTVLKQVQVAAGNNWLETYFIYDDFGRLVYQLPPKAVATLGAGTTLDANNPTVAELIYKYTYDTRGRVVEKKIPGAAIEYNVYDKLDRLALSQNGYLKAQNLWAFIKYDLNDRPVYNGTYASTESRATLQAQLNAIDYANQPWYETEVNNATYLGYSNTAFPTVGLTLLAANYYDNYDFDNNGVDDFTYSNSHLTGLPAAALTATRLLPTGSTKLLLGTTTWLRSAVFYDSYDRTIQTQSFNHLNTATPDISSILYADLVHVSKTKQTHNGPSVVNVTQTIVYDNQWRTHSIIHQINNNAPQVLANYRYNALGKLIEKNLYCSNCRGDVDGQAGKPGTVYSDAITHSVYNASEPELIAKTSVTLTPGFEVLQGNVLSARTGISEADYKAQVNSTTASFIQSVDYRYNIRGWLVEINNAQLMDFAMIDGIEQVTDYFGMELFYNNNEGTTGFGNTPAYNGNIAAIKWKGPGHAQGVSDQRAYKYTYDYSDRLTTAAFAVGKASWTGEANTLNETMTYDVNGNILTLARNQNLRGNTGTTITATPQTIDNLTYTYTANTNQLVKVEDTMIGVGDFKNGANTPTEYLYNTDGSLTRDDNKGISGIDYNLLGKPEQITFTSGKKIEYTYDAAGTKLTTKTWQGTTLLTNTHYVGGFVYEGATPALSFFSSPEGRVVKNGNNYEYQYAIADHQGNTRVLFTSATPAPVATGTTMEAPTDANFDNYTNRVGFDLMDHTDAGATYQYSQKLTGGHNAQVGIAKSYKVYAGDKVKIEAFAKYTNPTSTGSNIAGFASALFAAFGVPAPVGGEVGTVSSALNNWGGLVAAGTGGSNPGGPKAFVNIIIFDKNHKLLDASWDGLGTAAEQVGATPVVPHEYMMQEYTVKEEGYVYMYVSNENATLVDVYFDDVTMTHTPSNILQYNEYYPFGVPTANSWTRENALGNNFLGNGGTELNTTSQLYDLDYRNYDPVLGRMNGVDPMASKYASLTPYNFSFNDPVTFSDPSGADPDYRGELYHYNARAAGGGSLGIQDGAGKSGSSYGRGGFFSSGWRPGSGSLSAGAFAQADAYFLSRETTTITDPGLITAFINAMGSTDERTLYGANINGGYQFIQIDQQGSFFVPYTEEQLDPNEYLSSFNPMNGAPDGLDTYVPIWGSGKQAAYWFDNGDVSRGMMYSALAISDVFLVKALVTSVAKFGLTAAAKNSTTIYRAVSKAELDDIAKFGLRNKAGAYETGKLFAPTLKEAAKFGKNNFMFDGLPNTLIKVQVPSNVMSGAFRFGADGMNAIAIPANQLSFLRATPLNFSPLIK